LTAAVAPAGAASQPLARSSDAVANPNVASGAPVSSEVIFFRTSDASASVVPSASRDSLARSEYAQSRYAIADRTGSVEAVLGPRFAGLVSDFLPVDRATLERAVDRFLDTFDRVAVELTGFEPSSALLVATGALGLTTLTLVAIKRRERSDENRDGSHHEVRRMELALLRTLPTYWNWDLPHR
jgi:hypothetical protein